MEIIPAPTRVLFVVELYLLRDTGPSTRSTGTTLKDILESRTGKRQFDLCNHGSGSFRNVGSKIACLLDIRFLA